MKKKEILEKVEKGDYLGALGYPPKDKIHEAYMRLRTKFVNDKEVILSLTTAYNHLIHDIRPDTIPRKKRQPTRKKRQWLLVIIIVIIIWFFSYLYYLYLLNS